MALLLALLPLVALSAAAPPSATEADPPQVLFQDLFVAVQTAGIYPDSKAFADAIPAAAPADILAAYHALRPDSPMALKGFADARIS